MRRFLAFISNDEPILISVSEKQAEGIVFKAQSLHQTEEFLSVLDSEGGIRIKRGDGKVFNLNYSEASDLLITLNLLADKFRLCTRPERFFELKEGE